MSLSAIKRARCTVIGQQTSALFNLTHINHAARDTCLFIQITAEAKREINIPWERFYCNSLIQISGSGAEDSDPAHEN
jgi:hypothetical protein